MTMTTPRHIPPLRIMSPFASGFLAAWTHLGEVGQQDIDARRMQSLSFWLDSPRTL